MKLTVKTLKGMEFEIRVQHSDTIMVAKKKIEEILGKDSYPWGQQLLVYKGKVLKDESTLDENEVTEDEYMVVMFSKPMRVGREGRNSDPPLRGRRSAAMKLTVKTLKGMEFEIRVQHNDTIMVAKKKIEEILGKDSYPWGQQLLVYKGKVLKDESTLDENEVTEDEYMVVMFSKSKAFASSGASSAQDNNLAGRAILRPGGVHATGRSCCGRSGGGKCLPGFVLGHGGMSLSGRFLSKSFDDGGVVSSLDEVHEEEGAWAPPGWWWFCPPGGRRTLERAAIVPECPCTVWFPSSQPCHCHSSEMIQGCIAQEDAHVGRYLSHWSELPRGWVVVLGSTGVLD